MVGPYPDPALVGELQCVADEIAQDDREFRSVGLDDRQIIGDFQGDGSVPLVACAFHVGNQLGEQSSKGYRLDVESGPIGLESAETEGVRDQVVQLVRPPVNSCERVAKRRWQGSEAAFEQQPAVSQNDVQGSAQLV